MIAVGALAALLVPPAAGSLAGTAEFVGSLIGTIGAVFLVAGLFYAREPAAH